MVVHTVIAVLESWWQYQQFYVSLGFLASSGQPGWHDSVSRRLNEVVYYVSFVVQPTVPKSLGLGDFLVFEPT